MNKLEIPETWNDEKTIEQDLCIRLQAHHIKLSNEAKQAFRIGWKAGAMQATVNMGRWMQEIKFFHGEPEREEYEGN